MPSFLRSSAIPLTVVLTLFSVGGMAQPTLPRDRVTAVPGAIRSFIDRLYSPDPKERAEAACEIGERHADAASAIPILLSMLSDDVTVWGLECDVSPWLRRTIAGNPQARAWMETSPAQEAAEALGEIGDAAVPGLLQALGHTDWKTRKFAALALGEVDHISELAKVIDALTVRLTDVHPGVRARVAWALGEIEHPSAVNGLVAALKDSDADVRERSVWALGEIESPEALPGLVQVLTGSDVELRRQAAWALGEIEDPRAIDDLRAAAADSNVAIRRAVRKHSASSTIGITGATVKDGPSNLTQCRRTSVGLLVAA